MPLFSLFRKHKTTALSLCEWIPKSIGVWLGFLAGLLVIVFAFLIWSGYVPVGAHERLTTSEPQPHMRGSEKAPVTIVEYTNLACPYCAQLHTTLQTVASEYGSRVRWELRHFPQDLIDPTGRALAHAAECIASFKGEDRFWQAVDRLFSVPAIARFGTLNEMISEWSIPQDRLDSCSANTDIENRINRDLQEGLTRGIRGVPALLVNDELIPGAVSLDQLKEKIDGLLDGN